MRQNKGDNVEIYNGFMAVATILGVIGLLYVIAQIIKRG